MRFNFHDFDIKREIDKRVQIEAEKEWAARPTPEWKIIPDEPLKTQPSLIIVKRFIMSLRP